MFNNIKIAVVLAFLLLSLPAQANHDLTGGPSLVLIVDYESYFTPEGEVANPSDWLALHCRIGRRENLGDCIVRDYNPNRNQLGFQFLIHNQQEGTLRNGLQYNGITDFSRVAIARIAQTESTDLFITCPTNSNGNAAEALCNIESCRHFLGLLDCQDNSTFFLLTNSSYTNMLRPSCRERRAPCSLTSPERERVLYDQTPVVIKNNNFFETAEGPIKAFNCRWPPRRTSDNAQSCRLVSDDDCSEDSTDQRQCEPQLFILHLLRLVPKPGC